MTFKWPLKVTQGQRSWCTSFRKPWVGIGSVACLSSVCLLPVTFVNCGRMLRNRPIVTMIHYWEVDIGLSESATNDLGWPWRGHFKITNVKIAYIFLMVRDKHVVTLKHYWEVNDIGLSEFATNLTLDYLEGSFQGHGSENCIRRLIGERWTMLVIGHLISFNDFDLQEYWFVTMSRPSQQQFGFL